MAWLGVRLDPIANAANATCISAPDSEIEVRVIAADEEAMIARHTRAIITGEGPPSQNISKRIT